MNRLFIKIFLITSVWITWAFVGCRDDPTSIPSEPVVVDDGSWMIYSPYKWPHDGRPYYSVYCNVYSDGVSDELKQQAGIYADEKFLQVLSFF